MLKFSYFPQNLVVFDMLINENTNNFSFTVWLRDGFADTEYVTYDSAFNVLTSDTLWLHDNTPFTLGANTAISTYRDSLFVCMGRGLLSLPPNNHTYSVNALIVQKYDSVFNLLNMHYYYEDSTIYISPSIRNSLIENKQKAYFIRGTMGILQYPSYGSLIIKLDSNLNKIWQKHIECNSATMRLMDMKATDDGGILILTNDQTSFSGAAKQNAQLIKINSNGEVTSIIDLQLPSHRLRIEISPNPTTNKLNVSLLSSEEIIAELQILDMQGKQILYKSVGAQQTTIDVSKFASGAYIIEGLSRAGKSFSAKFLKN